MKKLFIPIMCISLMACNKNAKDEKGANPNTVVWAKTAETWLAMEHDSSYDKEWWDKVYQVDKEKIFNSIVNAVKNGKLKAYPSYSDKEMSLSEFNDILVKWDSTHQMEDVNNPGTFIVAPLKYELKVDDVAQLRFTESIELDTLTYTLTKKIQKVKFIGNKTDESGNVMGMKPLFDVRLNDGSVTEMKK